VVAGPPVDLTEFDGQPLSNAVLRAATNKIMTDIAALLGGLRGQPPPAEFYHPAVARRKLRQDLRALSEAAQRTAAAAPDPAGTDPASTDPAGTDPASTGAGGTGAADPAAAGTGAADTGAETAAP
jgi:hypothetical protein